MDLSGYTFATLYQDGEFVLRRGRAVANPTPSPPSVLVSMLASEHPLPAHIRMLERELVFRDDLDPSWALRPLGLGQHERQPALIFEDQQGEPLARLLDKATTSHALTGGRAAEPAMELGVFLRLAIGLASAVDEVHRRGIVHKNIKPAHILVNAATNQVWLTGFGMASRLPHERQALEPPETIAGTLAYMAPEQTGRMNRSIDRRSDLYAVGITLYQMLTGSLPFTASEPIEWVHCHIARQPLPPNQRVENVPSPVSAIIMKLLAKTAEERYQTAASLGRDLGRCLTGLEAQGRVNDFALGERDTPDRLLIPEKLYGRTREIDTLLAAFDRVVHGGTPELVLVSGYSGIGKSAVVHELHKVLVPPRALFAMGKFDQYKRDIPYSTLAQALQGLIRLLLTKREDELSGWRQALREALGPNGQLMVDLVPELKAIVGEQPAVPELPPQDAQRRFQLVFRRLLGVFARPEHPLALFLDDLQWLDAATLDLLQDLMIQPDVRHVLLIGAYRDNEVTSAHPLMRRLETIRSTGGTPVHQIALAPLGQEDVSRMIEDSLHCSGARATPLAQLVHEKSAGNPFFAIQFLSTLVDEALVTFDHAEAGWRWDLTRIYAKGYTDNVVDLMVGKLHRLPADTQRALRHLACLGNRADAAMLAMVYGDATKELDRDLQTAQQSGLVLRSEDAYRFLHDRVQEAAYSLISPAQRATVHLRIGRLLAAHTPPEQREDAIFEIVNQLNRATDLISSRAEKEQLAHFNLIAGKRAKASTAYASALTYLVAGTTLLSDDGWAHQPDLMFALELYRAECEFLTAEYEAADARLATLASRTADVVHQAAVACLRIDLYTTLDRSDRSVDVLLAYLRHSGIEWSSHPTEEEARREYERTWSLLGRREIEELIELPLMTKPEIVGTLGVLIKALAPAQFTDAHLASLLVCRMVNLSLEHGNTDASCQAYVWLGMIAGACFGDYQAAFRFGRLGYELVERHGLVKFEARTRSTFCVFIVPWTAHLRTGHDLFRRMFDQLNAAGDLTFAAYSRNNLITSLLGTGEPLVDVQREAEQGLTFARNARFGLAIDFITAQLALIHALRGLTATFGCFDGPQFDERQFERHLSNDPVLAIAACWYWIRKMQSRFFAGDYVSAVDASLNAQRLLWTSPSTFETAEAHFYGALSHAASCDVASHGQHRPHVDALIAHHKQLLEWAEHCPDNFADRALLVGAEIARIEGRELDAERLYEAAITSARENGFIQNEALANELAARFYTSRGFERIAKAYLRDARDGYKQWGADGKVRQLEERHPRLRGNTPVDSMHSVETAVEHLDLATVLKVLQAVSVETDLQSLIAIVMRLALEHAGAERGLLILPHRDAYRIEAEARVESHAVSVDVRPASIAAGQLPESVFHYVLRTKQSVLLRDASVAAAFAEDEYVQRSRARSVLCMPLVKQARVVGVIYLENNLTAGAFTSGRMALLDVLASEAAISLENAVLYHDLQERERESRIILDSIPGMVALLNASGDVEVVNPQLIEYFGQTLEQLRQWRVTDTIHPEDLPHVIDVFTRSIATGDPYEILQRFRRSDGVYRWFLNCGLPVRDSSGEIVRWCVLLTDIDQRKRAEDALRASERSLQLIIDTIPALAWSARTDGSAEFFNRHYLDFIGLSSEQASGWGWTAAVHGEDVNDLASSWQHIMASNASGEAEARLRRHDGSYRWFLVRANPLRDEHGTIVKWYGINTDIEDRKQAEAELRRAYDSFADAQRLSHTGSFITDLVGDDHNWSEEAFRIFDFEPGSKVSVQRIRDIIHPDDSPSFESVIARGMQGENVTFAFRIVTATRAVKHVRGVAHVVEHVAGRPLFVGALQDVTESKVAEEALDRARSELAHVARVTAVSAFTASIAHEVNQPLSGIMTNAGTCLRMLAADPPDVDGARETAKRTLRDGNRASDVITRLRALFSKREFALEPLDINEVTQEVLALSLSELQRNRVVLRSEFAPDLPRVTGDRIQLQQVILNLVRNASDAMTGVHDRPRHLLIGTSQEADHGVRVTVRDAGEGLDAQSVNKLFDAFYTTKANGMGIGLSVSRSIIERHRGRLWAEANDGPGATFAFAIPAVLETVAPASDTKV